VGDSVDDLDGASSLLSLAPLDLGLVESPRFFAFSPYQASCPDSLLHLCSSSREQGGFDHTSDNVNSLLNTGEFAFKPKTVEELREQAEEIKRQEKAA
jgi:hypothetical protein